MIIVILVTPTTATATTTTTTTLDQCNMKTALLTSVAVPFHFARRATLRCQRKAAAGLCGFVFWVFWLFLLKAKRFGCCLCCGFILLLRLLFFVVAWFGFLQLGLPSEDTKGSRASEAKKCFPREVYMPWVQKWTTNLEHSTKTRWSDVFFFFFRRVEGKTWLMWTVMDIPNRLRFKEMPSPLSHWSLRWSGAEEQILWMIAGTPPGRMGRGEERSVGFEALFSEAMKE